ncbi:hypothetical protein [Microbacterium sp. CPCC 204701]|uniref:hypothetical protein n=1 Tax=Microbacterium sp. CPCC 204701 TaxID=2493084 RepID=UPI001F0BB815|nr:hypothetical protein [Microbacterium sp. CPCC 204701]
MTTTTSPASELQPSRASAGETWTLRIAGILLLAQGAVMELGVFIGLLVLTASGVPQEDAGERFSFIVPFLQENLYLMMAMSGIFGALRVVGAIGVLRNRMWGFSLSVINCSVTLTLMVFLLPAGMADGLLSGTALVLLLIAFYGSRPITPRGSRH